MPGDYSQELRDRVINAVIHGGVSCRGAGERFEVSEAAASSATSRRASRSPGPTRLTIFQRHLELDRDGKPT